MNTQETLTPWNETDKENWFKEQKIKRSYQNEVASKIHDLRSICDVVQYGSLAVGSTQLPFTPRNLLPEASAVRQ